jgi:drug/metabolite transporter (DMT)-like permease
MLPTYFVAVICVIGLAIGQILFKISATAITQANTVFTTKALVSLFAAMGLYAFTSLAWVWVLRKIELGRVYPLMALAFVLVPIGSHFIFGERFQQSYFFGVALIALGIIVVVRS